MKQIFLFIVYIFWVNSWTNFSQFPRLRKCGYLSMAFPTFELETEYIEFYNKYKINSKQEDKRALSKIEQHDFIRKNLKNYEIFQKNYHLINQANKFLKSENKSFSLSLNPYADIIDFDDEYTQTDLMINPIKSPEVKTSTYLKALQAPIDYLDKVIKFDKLSKFNWNDTGLLTPIKNQGRCGSCWAFAVTTSLETFMRNRQYNITRLSEQQLVNCSPYDYGCNGGMMHTAFDYIIENDGLYSNDDYPYVATTNNCTNLPNYSKVPGSNLKDYKFVIPKSIIDMKVSLLENPIAIAVDADNIYFRFYEEGVIDVPSNFSSSLNHAVLLVGFDYDEQGEYWIIQNSWGKKWGMDGFAKIRIAPDEGVLLCQTYGVYPSR